jgi:peroxin-4
MHDVQGTVKGVRISGISAFVRLAFPGFAAPAYAPGARAQTGEICLDILKNAWSPAWTLQSVCQAILALMSDAAPDSPLNCDAGNLLRANDRRGYNSLARMYTLELAMPR